MTRCTGRYLNTPLYKGAILWDNLPSNVQRADTTETFVKYLCNICNEYADMLWYLEYVVYVIFIFIVCILDTNWINCFCIWSLFKPKICNVQRPELISEYVQK